jgi:hypothetical protein
MKSGVTLVDWANRIKEDSLRRELRRYWGKNHHMKSKIRRKRNKEESDLNAFLNGFSTCKNCGKNL